jgi:RND family efflux transporter MFP subunit
MGTGLSAGRWEWRLVIGAIFLAALAAGVTFQGRIGRGLADLIPPPKDSRKVLYWISPHDPSRHVDHPGKDAMGMDLTPIHEGQEAAEVPTINPVIQESEFTSVPVERGQLVRMLRTVSTVEYAEPLIGEVTLKVDAWLEKLYVDYEGKSVRKGDRLFEVYSPDLLATMQDLIVAARYAKVARDVRNDAAGNAENVRRRLRYWDVSEAQIGHIESSKTVPETVTFTSPFSGIVIEKKAFEGTFVKAGGLLYRIADLSKVWVYVFVYQAEIDCVSEGQPAKLTLPELPGRTFEGKVIYIYPYLEPKIRAVKARLEFDNPDLALRPDMFAHVQLAPHRMGVGLKVPRAAVLDTGRRKFAYVARPEHMFEPREVTTGMSLDGDMVEILSGLAEGEAVVTSSQFLLDSESRLRSINRKFEPLPPPAPVSHEGMPGMESMPGMKGMEEGPGADMKNEAPKNHQHEAHHDRE